MINTYIRSIKESAAGLEIRCAGSVITLTDQAEIEAVKHHIRDAKRFLPKPVTDEAIYTYLEYLDSRDELLSA